MRFGLSFAQLNPSAWIELATLADELGFESVWQSDHVAIPSAGFDVSNTEARVRNPATPLLDVFATLGFIAARTKVLRLGTFIYVAGLRHPLTVARGFATLDHLSHGRVIPGFGVGSIPEEFSLLGLDPSTRGRRLNEAIDVCRAVWAEEREVAYRGEFYAFQGVMVRPGPEQSYLPIHVGGESPAALRRAAWRGDGWLAQHHDPASLEPLVTELRKLEAVEGRTQPLEVTVVARSFGPEEIERFANLGVDRMIVTPWKRTSGAIEGIRRFAEQNF